MPNLPNKGVSGSLQRMRPMKSTLVSSNTVGVMVVSTLQPYLQNITLLSNIMMKLEIPVHVEKSPMNEKYSFGLGNYPTHKLS